MEVHVIDFQGDLYGAEMEVEFIDRIRGEVAFSSTNDLIQQIESDIALANRMLNR